jgi:hypothetical protein
MAMPRRSPEGRHRQHRPEDFPGRWPSWGPVEIVGDTKTSSAAPSAGFAAGDELATFFALPDEVDHGAAPR